ncbi:ABC-2 type transporter family protein isoform 1 [Hibiscus syriacus]|uniref:ABC-2 type transporter family protein isoform 1 n=1 Tax=Hibiscus syriacus TaxID=106335 RepID=A0A6A3AZY2_HIBSY|nr:ABC-2 type transporter family protein isoform 1 [Hibiscus syriacus]
MEATISSLRYSSTSALFPPRPFSGKSKTVIIRSMASKRSDPYNHDFDGKLVDESMIVLRKRIREIKTAEESYEPPRNWTEWEKQYKREKYDVDVCEAMGSLQTKLMETRPGVALGMGVLLLFSLPTSMAAVLFHVMANWPR